MSTLTWSLPVATTLQAVPTRAIIGIEDFNMYAGAGVMWALTRFILSYTKRFPERVLQVGDALYCAIVFWEVARIIGAIYRELGPILERGGLVK